MNIEDLAKKLEKIHIYTIAEQEEIGKQAAALLRQGVAPEDFQLVPKEPSWTMLEEMRGVHGQQDSPKWYQRQRRRYRAMLRESPKPGGKA